MKKLFLGALLALMALPAMANIVITWTAPTQREDGTVLLPSEIASYTLNVTLGGVAQPDITIPGSAVTYTFADTVKGKYCFTMETVDTQGLTSVPTSPVCRNANPKAPSNTAAK